jgi:hypothetical protein
MLSVKGARRARNAVYMFQQHCAVVRSTAAYDLVYGRDLITTEVIVYREVDSGNEMPGNP